MKFSPRKFNNVIKTARRAGICFAFIFIKLIIDGFGAKIEFLCLTAPLFASQ